MNEKTPKVSVLMPCLNEEKNIGAAITSLIDDYVLQSAEILVLDGGSTDHTRQIVESVVGDKIGMIRIIENPNRHQASGLNIGLKEARGEFIVRTDAHSVYPPGYVRKCVELLEGFADEVANVGGYMKPEGETIVQKAIAFALQHPVGVGDANWRRGTSSGFVDTVYLGTFRKSLFKEIGDYDERATPNEDAELNIRILKAGRKIYLDNSIKTIYFPRKTLQALGRQYFHYGRGRAHTIFKHKTITSWRQVAPLLLVSGLAASMVLGICRPLFFLFPVIYLLALIAVAMTSFREKKAGCIIPIRIRMLTAIAWAIMQIAWGIGFISRIIKS